MGVGGVVGEEVLKITAGTIVGPSRMGRWFRGSGRRQVGEVSMNKQCIFTPDSPEDEYRVRVTQRRLMPDQITKVLP